MSLYTTNGEVDESTLLARASSTKLANLSDMHISFIFASLQAFHSFATEMTNEEMKNCCQMVSHVIHHFTKGVTIHVVPTRQSALEQVAKMNGAYQNTAVAVFQEKNSIKNESTFNQLVNHDTISSVFISADDLSSSAGEDLVSILKNGSKLARFVVDEAEGLPNGTFQYEELIVLLSDNKEIPVMSWSHCLSEARLDTVLQCVGMSSQHPILLTSYYCNFLDSGLFKRQEFCDKFILEKNSFDSRDMTQWARYFVETLEEKRNESMSHTVMIPLLLGHPSKFAQFGTRENYGAMHGFHEFTVKKIFDQLLHLGIFKKVSHRMNMDVILEKESAATAALKSGHLQIHLPVKHIYITGQACNPDIFTLRVPFHDVKYCSCNTNKQIRGAEDDTNGEGGDD